MGARLVVILLDFLKALRTNLAYIIWFLFYFLLFMLATNGYAIYFYLVTIPLALLPLAEGFWRIINGIRPLRLQAEKERLLPLFKEAYEGAIKVNPALSKGIKLYVHKDMDINAFAFGKRTMILTRGSIELLSDDCIKGLMAHEFGHFSHKHTQAVLLSTIGNLPMVLVLKVLFGLKEHISKEEAKSSFVMKGFRALYSIIYYFFKGIDLIGELILMHTSRKHELQADKFAMESGLGEELVLVLREINQVGMEKKQSIKERLRNSHPHITRRIEALESSMD